MTQNAPRIRMVMARCSRPITISASSERKVFDWMVLATLVNSSAEICEENEDVSIIKMNWLAGAG